MAFQSPSPSKVLGSNFYYRSWASSINDEILERELLMQMNRLLQEAKLLGREHCLH
ncbi:hypothetical protein NC653_019360 [Populus alba x Populus x berolinensis]|uniref:Uncharacterized protein n=1 Tax=Populus alba x Populus x berolinensis TaxID=444605 RepID=A0AAD6QIP8_9ROSI|nr:hypothetical protein NC653_019360 [Populus alba x Populus x berolinensis]